MNIGSILDIANRILEENKSVNGMQPTVNPTVRYVRKPPEVTASAAVKTPEESLQDKRRLGAYKAPEKVPVNKTEAVNPTDKEPELGFDFTSQGLLNGIIMSEVLGRPKCFTTGRRTGRR